MARLRDVPIVIRRQGFFPFLKNIWKEVGQDAMFTYASALAYSWLFAIFPFFIFLLSLLPYLPEHLKFNAQEQIGAILREQMPSKASETLITGIENLMNNPKVDCCPSDCW